MAFLYEQYSEAIFGVITRIIKDKKIAEEVLQQCFLKAWNKIHLYSESKSTLYTWLSAIARNAAIDKVRLKSYQNHNKSESLDLTVHDSITSNTDHSGIDTNELLKKLDDKYRIVLDMMYLQGYTQAEISKNLDVPLGTVKTRLKKAIEILRENLKDEKGLFIGLLLTITLMLLLCHLN